MAIAGLTDMTRPLSESEGVRFSILNSPIVCLVPRALMIHEDQEKYNIAVMHSAAKHRTVNMISPNRRPTN